MVAKGLRYGADSTDLTPPPLACSWIGSASLSELSFKTTFLRGESAASSVVRMMVPSSSSGVFIGGHTMQTDFPTTSGGLINRGEEGCFCHHWMGCGEVMDH